MFLKWFSLLSFSLPLLANTATDACRDILAEGIFDTFNHTHVRNLNSEQKAFLCSDESSLKKRGLDIGFTYKGSEFKLGSSGHDEYKRNQCSDDERKVKISDHTYDYMRIVNPNVVDAWSRCMQSNSAGGFFCYLRSNDGENGRFDMVVHYYPPAAYLPFAPNPLKLSSYMSNLESLQALPTDLSFVEMLTLDVKVKDLSKVAKIKLTGMGMHSGFQCEAQFNPMPKLESKPCDTIPSQLSIAKKVQRWAVAKEGGTIYRCNAETGEWRVVIGSLKDITVCNGQTWGVNLYGQIYRWRGGSEEDYGNTWSRIIGSLDTIDCNEQTGRVYGRNNQGDSYEWNGAANDTGNLWRKI